MPFFTDFRVVFTTASPTLSEMWGALIGRTVDLTTEHSYPGEGVYVMRVDGDGAVVVCETDEQGRPLDQSTWAIPQHCITRVTVPLGDAA